jgi:hypothetical protein
VTETGFFLENVKNGSCLLGSDDEAAFGFVKDDVEFQFAFRELAGGYYAGDLGCLGSCESLRRAPFGVLDGSVAGILAFFGTSVAWSLDSVFARNDGTGGRAFAYSKGSASFSHDCLPGYDDSGER